MYTAVDRTGSWRSPMGDIGNLDDFLARPLVARVATHGPTVQPVWYIFEERAFWWLTRLARSLRTPSSAVSRSPWSSTAAICKQGGDQSLGNGPGGDPRPRQGAGRGASSPGTSVRIRAAGIH